MPKTGKNKPVIWAEQAKQDLERIFDHIAENFSIELALEKTTLIFDEIESLSGFPRKGSISDFFNEMRELVVEGNTVYYRNNEADIVIASIRPRRTAPKKP
jgi:plasmid stabilization system protein ParE